VLRERVAPECVVDGFLRLAGNPRRVGEDPSVGRGIELGLELRAHLAVCCERFPIDRNFLALREFVPVRSGT
jgi:hypothetical protein